MIFSTFRWSTQEYLELTRPTKAYVYFRNRRLDLLSGFPETYSIYKLNLDLQEISMSSKFKRPRVFHFFYEWGLLSNEIDCILDDDTPLVIEIEYQRFQFKSSRPSKSFPSKLKFLERPTWGEYREAFAAVQAELRQGNCYQLNLTYPFDMETENFLDPRDIRDYFFRHPHIGSFAHASFFGEEMILSNSPECLFDYHNGVLKTMPIKGTMKLGSKSFKAAWDEMQKSVKEVGELNMITDLLRNDLSRLGKPIAEVKKLRSPLRLKNILHQYSLITTQLADKTTLGDVMSSLFPGGSITGAPKKRVMEIIHRLERYQRGIYCGSTVLCWRDRKVGSINIRTASIRPEHRLWRYGAGGGITLLSQAAHEFKEMELKVESFTNLFRPL